MLTVSSLPGLPDLLPVKPDVSGGGGFAPLIARLLGPEIKVDCISLPRGGEMLPVAMPGPIPVTAPTPVSLSVDAPAVPPAILVVPGSPSLIDHDEPPPAPPVAIPSAPTPVRFAPIAVPVALAASPPPATDPALPPVAADVAEEPRLATVATRTALLTSAATPPPVTPTPNQTPTPTPTLATPRPTIDPPAIPVVPGRKNATTEPVSRAVDDDAQPIAGPVPAPVRPDAPVALEAIQLTIAPVSAPPPVENSLAMTTVSAPIAASRTAPRPAPSTVVSRPTTGAVAPAPPTAQGPGRKVGTDSAPATVRSVIAPTTLAVAAAAIEQKVDDLVRRQTPAIDPVPLPSLAGPPVTLDRPARTTMAPSPAIEPGQPVSTDPAPAGRPTIAATPSLEAPAVGAPFVQPMPTAAQPVVLTPAPVVGLVATTPLVVADTPIRAAGTDGPLPGDVMAPAPDAPRRDAPATERPPSIPTALPATPQAAAPVILPALQAFGAAIRRAMADERKPAPSGDDTILGLPTLAATTAPATAPATAQPVAASDTTLDTADRRWPHAMAEQIEKLRDIADSQSTRIRLLPDALGPVDVAVRRDGDQVHVHFAAVDAQTRQLLADAQPRLADAAEARGLKLGRTDVSGGDLTGGDRQQQQRSSPQSQQPSRSAPARARAATADTDDSRLA